MIVKRLDEHERNSEILRDGYKEVNVTVECHKPRWSSLPSYLIVGRYQKVDRNGSTAKNTFEETTEHSNPPPSYLIIAVIIAVGGWNEPHFQRNYERLFYFSKKIFFFHVGCWMDGQMERFGRYVKKVRSGGIRRTPLWNNESEWIIGENHGKRAIRWRRCFWDRC